jgi:membrane protease YdiL (CAAX protease family)
MDEERPILNTEPGAPGEPGPGADDRLLSSAGEDAEPPPDFAGEPEQAEAPPPGPPLAPPPQPPERYPFWGYSDLFLFAGLTIPAMLMGWAIVKGIMLLARFHPAVRVAELLPEQFAGYVILFGALALIFRVEYDRPFWSSLGWRRFRAPALWVVSAGLATAFAVALVSGVIRTPTAPNPMTELMRGRTAVILLAIFGITAGPVCEELAFRGFLQPLLVRSLGAAPGIIAAAIPFGLLHYQEYGNSWQHVLLISGAGAAFGWVRHATGSTKASALMHAAYNALFFFALFLPKQGGHT